MFSAIFLNSFVLFKVKSIKQPAKWIGFFKICQKMKTVNQVSGMGGV